MCKAMQFRATSLLVAGLAGSILESPLSARSLEDPSNGNLPKGVQRRGLFRIPRDFLPRFRYCSSQKKPPGVFLDFWGFLGILFFLYVLEVFLDFGGLKDFLMRHSV